MTPAPSKSVLVVRSGGGAPGLDIHAGVWRALDEAGVHATACSGTSAGALVSALDGAGFDPFNLWEILKALTDTDIRQKHALWFLRSRSLDGLFDLAPIRRLIEGLIPGGYADLRKPVFAWTVNLETRETVNMARPELTDHLADALLASMAVPVIFPPVKINGVEYADGGMRFNLPLLANWRDFDEVWLVVASGRRESFHRRRGLLTRARAAIDIMTWDQTDDPLAEVAGAPTVRVIRPDLPTPRGMMRFDHDLIERAYEFAWQWILDQRNNEPAYPREKGAP